MNILLRRTLRCAITNECTIYIEGGHLGTALTVSTFYCSHTVYNAKAIQTQRVDIVVVMIRPIQGRMFIVSTITINI